MFFSGFGRPLPPRSCFVSQHSNINTFTAQNSDKILSRWNLNFMLPSLTDSNDTLSLFQVCKQKYLKYWPAKNTPKTWGNRVKSYNWAMSQSRPMDFLPKIVWIFLKSLSEIFEFLFKLWWIFLIDFLDFLLIF